MQNRLDYLLLAFVLIAVPLVQGIDHFFEETSLSQLVLGILIGLEIVAAVVFVYRVSSQTTQKR